MKIGNGSKVKVISGDRDTVLYDNLGTVKNLDESTGKCEIHLGSSFFYSNANNIALSIEERKDEDMILLS